MAVEREAQAVLEPEAQAVQQAEQVREAQQAQEPVVEGPRVPGSRGSVRQGTAAADLG